MRPFVGRTAFRASLERDDLLGLLPGLQLQRENKLMRMLYLTVVAINHTAPSLEYLLHSIKYDSTHGTCRHSSDLSIEDDNLVFRGRKIILFSQRDPLKLDWKSTGAEYVVESTGKMCTTELAYQHVTAGAKKVVISAPAK